jgi:hypothetical protein
VAIHEPLFTTTLQALGAIGLPVTFGSSFGAFVRSAQQASAERVAAAANHGTAAGFIPGSFLAIGVFVNGVWL